MITEDVWYDADAGPLVRLYAIIAGRVTEPAHGITLSAIVQRIPGATAPGTLSAPQHTILRLTERPVSVSELAAWLQLPLGPVRALLSELGDAGLITFPGAPDTSAGPTQGLLEQVLTGLRSL